MLEKIRVGAGQKIVQKEKIISAIKDGWGVAKYKQESYNYSYLGNLSYREAFSTYEKDFDLYIDPKSMILIAQDGNFVEQKREIGFYGPKNNEHAIEAEARFRARVALYGNYVFFR